MHLKNWVINKKSLCGPRREYLKLKQIPWPWPVGIKSRNAWGFTLNFFINSYWTYGPERSTMTKRNLLVAFLILIFSTLAFAPVGAQELTIEDRLCFFATPTGVIEAPFESCMVPIGSRIISILNWRPWVSGLRTFEIYLLPETGELAIILGLGNSGFTYLRVPLK